MYFKFMFMKMSADASGVKFLLGTKVGFPIAIFLWHGAELSNKSGEVIVQNIRVQYERSLAACSGAERFLSL
jgi:hypothetical protein